MDIVCLRNISINTLHKGDDDNDDDDDDDDDDNNNDKLQKTAILGTAHILRKVLM
jgi:hypothetical protein